MGGDSGSGPAPWPERHIPQGPSRGKAARAFGAGSRGPGLVARGGPGGVGALGLAVGGPWLTALLVIDFPGLSCCPEGADDNLAWPRGCLNISAPRRACRPDDSLPLSVPPPTLKAAQALDTAASGSRNLAPAPLDAPFLMWHEALVAALVDVRRLGLTEMRGPDGSPVWPIERITTTYETTTLPLSEDAASDTDGAAREL